MSQPRLALHYMARLPRLTLPAPHHIIQRGNNRQPIFADGDYQTSWTAGATTPEIKVAIHAYVLMGNHFHLLATPQTADGSAQLMQAVGRSYVRYFNDTQQRTGTLWEGRYRSTVIEADRYLLACMVYIDLTRCARVWCAGLTTPGPAMPTIVVSVSTT